MSQPLPVGPPTAFSRVPLELLLRITNHLSTKDICSLRLTCRSIELSLYETFSKEYFTKKQFMISSFSLNALIDISKSRLGHSLSHVIIGLDRFSSGQHFFGTTNAFENSRYVEGLRDQQALLETGDAITLLRTAFTELSHKSLKVIGIRDYASPARNMRDGPGSKWESYGATTILRDTGVNLMEVAGAQYRRGASDTDNFSTHMRQTFRIVLHALGTASVVPLSIEVLRHRGGYLTPGAFAIPISHRHIILPVLNNLETIFLPIRLGPKSHAAHYIQPAGEPPVRCPDYDLRLFLGHLTSLKHLRLNLSAEWDMFEMKFMKWLGEPPGTATQAPAPSGVPPSPEPIRLPSLVELNLGFCQVDPESLLRIIRKFSPTLLRLELYKIVLNTKTDDTFVYTDPAPCIWTTFLKNLRNIPNLKLSHLTIGEPMQMRKSITGPAETVYFKSLVSPPHDGMRMAQKRSYTGMDWVSFVKNLEKDVYVVTSSKTTVDDDEDEDMDDTSEGDDDEDDD